jgi:hypothetical protein
MAQLQRPSQKSNDAVIGEIDQDGREETNVSVQQSPMMGTVSDDAMSRATGGDQTGPAKPYDSSMSLPFQTDQLGKAGEAQDVGPVSSVVTRREVYVSPGGEVTEQVTEYATTTTMQPGAGNETVFDQYYNVTAAGAPGYDQMNPSAAYGNQALYETTGGLEYAGNGQFLPMPGFALSNPAIGTDPAAAYAAAVGTVGEGRSHAHAQDARPVDIQSTDTTTTE